MFTGIKAHHDAKRTSSYETAVQALEKASKTPTGKARQEKQYGFHLGMNRNHGVTWVREDEGDVVFRLYDTDVVRWHPDNSVEIENYGTVTTRDFVSRFIPMALHLNVVVSKRHMPYEGGNKGFTYRARSDDNWWDRRICQGHGNTVRFVESGDDIWLPDAETLAPMTFLDLDRKVSREISKRYPWKEFELWLDMAPRHMDRFEHDYWDVDECLEALEERDFRKAARHLPLIEDKDNFGRRPVKLPIITSNRDFIVTMSSIAKLRKAAYMEQGAFKETTVSTLTLREFDKRMAVIRELRALDVISGRDYGASQ